MLLSILEKIVLFAEVVALMLLEAAQERQQLFYPRGESLLPSAHTRAPADQGRATQKLSGTQDRVAVRRLPVGFLLLMVVQAILLAQWGGWTAHGHVLQTGTLSTPLKRWKLERQNKSWIFTEKLY